MSNKDRRLDLSAKFIKMGQALVNEGREKKDYSIAQLGNIMIFLSSLMYDEKDMNLFSEVTAMFSAKKILETMENENHDYINYLKGKSDSPESLDDFLKRINKLRKDNGHEPLG